MWPSVKEGKNMKMLEIAALPNGAHRNQTFHGSLPDGWAVIPEDMELPATFPFVEVEVKDVVHYKDDTVVEEGQEPETYTVPTVVSMTEGIMPERKPEVREPSQLDRIEAQITYTAMMTDTLLEV